MLRFCFLALLMMYPSFVVAQETPGSAEQDAASKMKNSIFVNKDVRRLMEMTVQDKEDKQSDAESTDSPSKDVEAKQDVEPVKAEVVEKNSDKESPVKKINTETKKPVKQQAVQDNTNTDEASTKEIKQTIQKIDDAVTPIAKVKKPISIKPETPMVTEKVDRTTPITKSRALSLAINNAPPSQEFDIFRAMQGQRRIYQALFKTENGLYEVQVDALNEEILYSDYRRDVQQYNVPAGHLPSRWVQ